MSVITQFITDKKGKHEFNQKVTAVEVSTEVKEECREFGASFQSTLNWVTRTALAQGRTDLGFGGIQQCQLRDTQPSAQGLQSTVSSLGHSILEQASTHSTVSVGHSTRLRILRLQALVCLSVKIGTGAHTAHSDQN